MANQDQPTQPNQPSEPAGGPATGDENPDEQGA